MRQILTILLCLLTAGVVIAQEKTGRTFVKITHSPDQTVAVDSSGQKWYYDADLGDFVRADEYGKPSRSQVPQPLQTPEGPSRGSEDEGDYGTDEVVLPPEIRCTDVHQGDLVDLFREVTVDIDQRIEGSVTCGKDVTVRGLVIGDVLSYRTVRVESTGEVRGDVIASEIIRERGGRILGKQAKVSLPGATGLRMPRMIPDLMPDFVGIFFTGFLIFVLLITIALAPNHVGRIVAKIEMGIIKSFFWGLLAWFSIVPVFILLIITIIGIPVAVLALPVLLLLAIILAYVCVAIVIGTWICPRVRLPQASIYVRGICGLVAIEALRLLGTFFRALGGEAIGGFLAVLYVLAVVVTLTTGLGSVVSARFGMRPRAAKAPSGAPPPSPRPGQAPITPPVTPPPPPSVPPAPRRPDATLSDGTVSH
jgi:hypothetical protein